MHLVLTLPGLLAVPAPLASAPRLTALAQLLATADAPRSEPEGIGALLAPLYGVARQSDWPIASLRLAALGVDPGEAYWLAADPVSLVAGRDDVRLAGAISDLHADEAQALITTLDAHFAPDGLAFFAPRPDAWFVRAPTRPRLTTHALDGAKGRALRALLPEGPDAGVWLRWLSEIQMLLHEHPVNLARERQGRAPVSSIWLSGGGSLPERTSREASVHTWAESGIAVALARHAGAPAADLPNNLGPLLRATSRRGALTSAHAQAETHVVAFDAPLDLDAIERMWAAPAWKGLLARTLVKVTLIADGEGEALAWTVRRPGLLARTRSRFAKHDLGALLDAFRVAR
jgi:hypothetical protein